MFDRYPVRVHFDSDFAGGKFLLAVGKLCL